MNKLKKEIIRIIDLNPFWFSLRKNPIKDIIQRAKTHQLISILEKLYGFKKTNPILGEIRNFHRKEPIVVKINSEIIKYLEQKINKESITEDTVVQTLQLLSKIIYFKVYNKKFIDLFFQFIVKNDLIGFTSFLKIKSLFIYYLNTLNFQNIHIDRYLKQISDCQLEDGGWPKQINIDIESNIFSTLQIYRTFAANPIWKNKKFLNKSNKFLLNAHMNPSSSKDTIDRWSRLNVGYKFNNLFEGGTLILLESLLHFEKPNKAKIKSIINWIESIQLYNGYFPYHANLKTEKNIDTTINVLYQIKRYNLKSI